MKHLLFEIEVSEKGQNDPKAVKVLIEDALFKHTRECAAGEEERSLFDMFPSVRIMSEEEPV